MGTFDTITPEEAQMFALLGASQGKNRTTGLGASSGVTPSTEDRGFFGEMGQGFKEGIIPLSEATPFPSSVGGFSGRAIGRMAGEAPWWLAGGGITGALLKRGGIRAGTEIFKGLGGGVAASVAHPENTIQNVVGGGLGGLVSHLPGEGARAALKRTAMQAGAGGVVPLMLGQGGTEALTQAGAQGLFQLGLEGLTKGRAYVPWTLPDEQAQVTPTIENIGVIGGKQPNARRVIGSVGGSGISPNAVAGSLGDVRQRGAKRSIFRGSEFLPEVVDAVGGDVAQLSPSGGVKARPSKGTMQGRLDVLTILQRAREKQQQAQPTERADLFPAMYGLREPEAQPFQPDAATIPFTERPFRRPGVRDIDIERMGQYSSPNPRTAAFFNQIDPIESRFVPSTPPLEQADYQSALGVPLQSELTPILAKRRGLSALDELQKTRRPVLPNEGATDRARLDPNEPASPGPSLTMRLQSPMGKERRSAYASLLQEGIAKEFQNSGAARKYAAQLRAQGVTPARWTEVDPEMGYTRHFVAPEQDYLSFVDKMRGLGRQDVPRMAQTRNVAPSTFEQNFAIRDYGDIPPDVGGPQGGTFTPRPDMTTPQLPKRPPRPVTRIMEATQKQPPFVPEPGKERGGLKYTDLVKRQDQLMEDFRSGRPIATGPGMDRLPKGTVDLRGSVTPMTIDAQSQGRIGHVEVGSPPEVPPGIPGGTVMSRFGATNPTDAADIFVEMNPDPDVPGLPSFFETRQEMADMKAAVEDASGRGDDATVEWITDYVLGIRKNIDAYNPEQLLEDGEWNPDIDDIFDGVATEVDGALGTIYELHPEFREDVGVPPSVASGPQSRYDFLETTPKPRTEAVPPPVSPIGRVGHLELGPKTKQDMGGGATSAIQAEPGGLVGLLKGLLPKNRTQYGGDAFVPMQPPMKGAADPSVLHTPVKGEKMAYNKRELQFDPNAPSGAYTQFDPKTGEGLHTRAGGAGTRPTAANEDIGFPVTGQPRMVGQTEGPPYRGMGAVRPPAAPGPMKEALQQFQQERGPNPVIQGTVDKGLQVVPDESLYGANWGVEQLDEVASELQKGTREALGTVERILTTSIRDFIRQFNPGYVLEPRWFTPEAYKAKDAFRSYQLNAQRLIAQQRQTMTDLGKGDPGVLENLIWSFHQLQDAPNDPNLRQAYLELADKFQQTGGAQLHFLQEWAAPDKNFGGLSHLPRSGTTLDRYAHEWFQQALAENEAYYLGRFYNKEQGSMAEMRVAPQRTFLPQGLQLRHFNERLEPRDWLDIAFGKEEATRIAEKILPGVPPEQRDAITMQMIKEAGYNTEVMAKMKEMGLDTSMYTIEMTNRHQSENVARMAYLDYIIKSPDLFQRIAAGDMATQQDLLQQGWLPISSVLQKGESFSGRLGPLNNIRGESATFIKPELRDTLSMLNTAGPEYWQGLYMDALRYWKILHTAWAPGVAGNNYLSAMLIHPSLAGYPIWRHGADARDTQFGKSGFWQQGDRYQFWRDQGLFKANNHFRIEMDSASTGSSPFAVAANTWLGKTVDGITQWKKAFTEQHPVIGENMNPLEFYGNLDDAGRMYLAEVRYKDLLGKGIPDADAALQSVAFAHKWQIDYANQPAIIRAAQTGKLGFLSPFITYPFGIAKLTMETLATRPWVLAEIPLFLTALNFANRSLLGMTPEEEEASKPHYMKGMTVLAPFKSTNQQPQYFDAARMYAPAQFASILQGEPYYLWNMLLPGGPVWPIVEAIRGYSLFFRENIFNPVTDTPGEKFGKGMEYIAEQELPIYNWAKSIPQAFSGKPYGVPERNRDIFGAAMRPFGLTIREGGVGAILGKMRQVKEGEIELNKARRKSQRELQEGFITPDAYQSSLSGIMDKRRALMERSRRTWPHYPRAFAELERSRNEVEE